MSMSPEIYEKIWTEELYPVWKLQKIHTLRPAICAHQPTSCVHVKGVDT